MGARPGFTFKDRVAEDEVFAAAFPLSLAPPPDDAVDFVGVEAVFEGEDFAAACPLSFAPPPEEPLFDGDDFAEA